MAFSHAAGRTIVAAGIAVGTIAVGSIGVATAANGGSLLLGHSNTATQSTTLKDPKGTALKLVGKKSAAPLSVNSSKMVAHLNAQFVGGMSAAQLAGSTVSRIAGLSEGAGTVLCPSGTLAIAGGIVPDPTGADDLVAIEATIANVTKAGKPNGWFGAAGDTDATYDGDGFVYVSCAKAASVKLSPDVAHAMTAEKTAAIRLAHARHGG